MRLLKSKADVRGVAFAARRLRFAGRRVTLSATCTSSSTDAPRPAQFVASAAGYRELVIYLRSNGQVLSARDACQALCSLQALTPPGALDEIQPSLGALAARLQAQADALQFADLLATLQALQRLRFTPPRLLLSLMGTLAAVPPRSIPDDALAELLQTLVLLRAAVDVPPQRAQSAAAPGVGVEWGGASGRGAAWGEVPAAGRGGPLHSWRTPGGGAEAADGLVDCAALLAGAAGDEDVGGAAADGAAAVLQALRAGGPAALDGDAPGALVSARVQRLCDAICEGLAPSALLRRVGLRARVRLLWCCAHWNARPPSLHLWLRSVNSARHRALAALGNEDLVAAVWSCAVLGVRPPLFMAAAADVADTRIAWRSLPADLRDLAAVVHSRPAPPAPAHAAAPPAAGEKGKGPTPPAPAPVRPLSLNQVCSLVWAFGQLAHHPGAFLAHVCVNYSALVLPEGGRPASVDMVARLLWGCARVGFRHHALVAAVTAWLEGGTRLKDTPAPRVTVILWSLAALRASPGAATEAYLCANLRRRLTPGAGANALGPSDVAGCAWALARLGVRDAGVFDAFAGAVLADPGAFGPPELSDIARGVASAGLRPPGFWETVERRVAEQLSAASPIDVLRVLSAYRQLGVPCDSLLASAQAFTRRRVAEMTPAGLAALLVRFAKADACEDSLTPAVMDALKPHVHALPAATLCRLAWALATLEHYDEAVMRDIAAGVLTHVRSLEGQALGSALWAFAKLSHAERALTDAVLARVIHRPAFLPPREVALVLQSLASTGYTPSTEVLLALEEAALHHLRRHSAQGLAMIMHSYAKLGVLPRRLKASVALEAAARALEFEPRHISTLLHAMAVLSARPDARLLEAMCQSAMLQAADFDAADLCNMVWALARMGKHARYPYATGLVQDSLAALEPILLPAACVMAASDVARALWAYGTAGCASPALMGALAARLRQVRESLSAQDVGSAVWGLGRLAHASGRGEEFHAGLDELLPVVERNITHLNPQGLTMLLEGLQGVSYLPTALGCQLDSHAAALVGESQPFELAIQLHAFAALTHRPDALLRVLTHGDEDAVLARCATLDPGHRIRMMWALSEFRAQRSELFMQQQKAIYRLVPSYGLSHDDLVLLYIVCESASRAHPPTPVLPRGCKLYARAAAAATAGGHLGPTAALPARTPRAAVQPCAAAWARGVGEIVTGAGGWYAGAQDGGGHAGGGAEAPRHGGAAGGADLWGGGGWGDVVLASALVDGVFGDGDARQRLARG